VIGQALRAGGVLSAARPIPQVGELDPPAGLPGLLTRLGELGAGAQVSRLLAASPRLLASPRGDGSHVIDLPGWRAPEETGAPIRAFLRRLGYEARGWGLGANGADPRRSVSLLGGRVRELAERDGRPVALVGWSLGGVIAREIARRQPEHVRHVVTYGSPIVGGPAHTVAARLFGPDDLLRMARIAERLDAEDPILVPITTIFSRRDGVVAWQACIDRTSPRATHYEVSSPHLGLGLDPDVWRIVAERLAS
jgi:pimeloyl-ACP methyl ester carboxylesterase